MKRSFCLLFLVAVATPFVALATPIIITTNDWQPYINPKGEPSGTAARIVEIVGMEMGSEIVWKYMPYDLAYYQVKTKKSVLSFPYFKTETREDEVLFSDPLFQAVTRVYFNRQFVDQDRARQDLDSLRKGKVAGYSYGGSIDPLLAEAKVYSSETDALLALFANEIDLLPMTENVMRNTLSRYFPYRTELIQQVDGISDVSTLHLIASKTDEGRLLIERFNKAVGELKQAGISSLSPIGSSEKPRLDIARLDVAEGYPVIIGMDPTEPPSYYTLPKGTRVIVIEWSEKITQASGSDRIYNNMMDMSRVVLLNGPLVGRELMVRNMHIELQ